MSPLVELRVCRIQQYSYNVGMTKKDNNIKKSHKGVKVK